MLAGMKRTELADVDLNLLVACEALLETTSVTATARRLRVTQSAVSHSLARLRELLGDPLLVRSGNRMVRTPRGERTLPLVTDVLARVRAVIDRGAAFDPSLAKRSFTIVASDYPAVLVMPPLVERLAKSAPGVDLLVRGAGRGVAEALGDDDADLVLAPVEGATPAGLVAARAFEDRFVCLVRRGHPALRGSREPVLDLEAFVALGHVLVAPRSVRPSQVDTALAALGLERRIAVEVSHFAAAPPIVARTDLVLTMPARLAAFHTTGAKPEVVIAEPPLTLPPVVFSVLWHERRHHDPAHAWFRQTVRTACPK